MDSTPAPNLKMECIGYPGIFDLDKALCKAYFRKYGKVRRLIYKQRQQAIVVEYVNEDEYLNALANAGDFNGHKFQVQPFESRGQKVPPHHASKKKHSRMTNTGNKNKVSYVDKDEINNELAAMGGYSDLKGFKPAKDNVESTKKVKAPKLNRLWKRRDIDEEINISATKHVKKSPAIHSHRKQSHDELVKKNVKEKIEILPAEQLELLKILNSQAQTVQDKYNILDARDKLLRSDRKISRLNSGPTQGTCPDMCPEKERLLREIRYQIALFEQNDGDRHTMDHGKAIKQYSRSSADQEAPLAHELRPISVLQLTMNYLIHNIVDLCDKETDLNIGEWYHFVWDRTRGIRKDITQQALSCQGTVELVEQCARFHIHCSARLAGEEPSVFDQKINTENLTKCLQTLKYMYHDLELKDENCANEAEFRAYIILLNLNDGNFLWEVQNLRAEIQRSAEVTFAIQVHSAIDKNNYVKFFKLIRSTTYLNACILMRYFVQVRLQAIEMLVKCYTPPKSISFYPVEVLMDLLYFDDVESTTEFLRMCGLSVNMDNNKVLIERNSFKPEEFSYVLERSTRVENKREGSVACVVSGTNTSPEMYLQMQTYQVHSSFDNKGTLIQDELFNNIEKRLEDTLLAENDDSRESSPERKNIVTNIFAQKSSSTNLKPITHSQLKEQNIFAQNKAEVASNIFAVQPKIDRKNEPSQFKPIFDNNSNSTPFAQNIFSTQLKDDLTANKSEANIFAKPLQKEQPEDNSYLIPTRKKETSRLKENIFSAATSANFNTGASFNFGVSKPAEIFKTSGMDETDNIESQHMFAKQSFDIPQFFYKNITNKASTDLPEEKNIFALASTNQNRIFNENASEKKGGFHFVLNEKSTVPQQTPDNIFSSGFKLLPVPETKMLTEDPIESSTQQHQQKIDKLQKQIEFNRKKAEEILRRKQNEEAAAKRSTAEEENLKREQAEMIESQQRDEARIKKENEKRRKAAAEAAAAENTRKKKEELEQRRRQREMEENREIQLAVASVVTRLVENVDATIRNCTLNRIRKSMEKRLILKMYAKWRQSVLQKIKLRKASNCHSVGVIRKSLGECAEDLLSKSQDLTLSHMRRYKYGRPVNILIRENPPVKKLNMYNLTYSSLRRRFCSIKEKWYQHIYWKVVVSIPDIDEMIGGLNKLEDTLQAYINWKLDKYGRTFYIEEHKTVTYCMEKRQGLTCVKSNDANAFIFIAKNFNDLLQERVLENLKGYGVCVTLPIVLILENTTNSTEYLESLQTSGVVSDCVIYSCSLCSSILSNIIDNALSVLSKSVEKYPPLEMDTFYGFIKKNLCSEIWKKAESYAKWNHEYNFCMRDPNIVIHLYNEGLNLLSDVILHNVSKEYATFPEEFRRGFVNKMPDFLPCDYRYFPNFWKTSAYESKLRKILENLKLPKFLENWPPRNETELLLSVSKYCTDIFKDPKAPYITLLNILKSDVTEDNQYDKILWTKAIQVISSEKLNEQNLDLPKNIFDDEFFQTFIIVYNKHMLNQYSISEWFYRNNPVIEGYKKTIFDKVEKEVAANCVTLPVVNRKRNLEIDEVIEKATKLLSSKKIHLDRKNQMEDITTNLRDLNDSMNVMRKINELSKSLFSE